MYFDGSLVYTFNTATFTQSFTAPLGNFTYTNYNPASAKYYSSKWWDGDTLVRDYIPVIDEDNAGYMLDKLSHTLYENKGTGSFNYGTKVYKPKLRLVEEKAGLSGLPNGFTEVEYLESSGTQYIDTGFIPNQDTKVELGAKITRDLSSGFPYFGSRTSSTSNGYSFQRYSNGKFGGQYGTKINNSTKAVDTNFHIILKDKNIIYMDGVIIETQDTATFTCPGNMYINAMNNNGTAAVQDCNVAYYYMKIWDNGNLIRDYIPVLDPNGRPAMYDKVEGKTYYNQETGEFNYGKQIIPVEYLESTGTQYIDAGVGGDLTTELTCEASITQAGNASVTNIMGNNVTSSRAITINMSANITNPSPSRIRFGNTDTTTVAGSINLNTFYKYDTNKNKLTVRDSGGTVLNTYSFNATTAFTTNGNILIFKLGDTSTQYIGKIKVKCATIKNSGVLVRDYIPVIDENNIGYMFDKVTHALYENKGTGAFSYGEKVYKRRLRLVSEPWYTKKYDLLTYLESTGTQWINTDLNGNLNTKIEAKVYSAKIDSTSGYCIAGDFTTNTKAITMPFNFHSDGLYSRFGDKAITTGIQQ